MEGELVPAEPWDGKPIIAVSWNEYMGLVREVVPHWVGAIRGPRVAFMGGRHAMLACEGITHETREEAAEALHRWAYLKCEKDGTQYDRDEWEVEYLRLVNAN